MMKKYGIFILLPLLAFTHYVFHMDDESSMANLPAPIMGTTVKWDMEDVPKKKDREEWFELMHQTAEGVDWKAIEHENMMASYKDKLRRKQEIGTRGETEPVAEGKLEGQWSERGASNVAGNVRITEYNATNEALYAISDGGTLWKGTITGFGWEVANQAIQFSSNLLEVTDLENGGVRIFAAISNVPHYSDDDGLSWNEVGNINGENGSRIIDAIKIMNETTQSEEIFFMHKESWNDAITVQRLDVNSLTLIKEKTFATSDTRNLSMSLEAQSKGIFILEQRSETSSRVHTWNPENEKFDITVDASEISSGDGGQLNIDAVMSNDTIRFFSYNGENELYRSDDLGVTWEFLSTLPLDPWAVGLFVSPSDPDNMMVGAVNSYRSINGGKNWSLINEWWEYYGQEDTKLHADIMYYEEYTDEDGEPFALISNHGGINLTRDMGKNNLNITLYGFGTAQYYDVRTYPVDSKWVFAGAQDQGFQRGRLQDDGEIGDFNQVISGDYGHIEFTSNGSNLWMIYPNGAVSFLENPTTQSVTAGYTIESMNETVWIAPMMPDPSPDNDIMYVAGGSATGGSGSFIIKLTYENGFISAEDMPYNFINDGTIASMATSPINSDLWYVGTTDGRFFTSTDRGLSFTESSLWGPGGHYLYGSGIFPSAIDEDVVYFCGSGYSGSAVYKSIDGGTTFSAMAEGLPPTLMYNLVGNEDESLFYAATEAGPYVYIVAEERWYDLSGEDTPTQTFWSVEYLPESQIARYGTYGRGIWDFKIENDFVDTDDVVINTKDLTIAPNPAREYIKLSTSLDDDKSYTMRIVDINGRAIKSDVLTLNTEPSIDISDLETGNYVIQLINKEQQYVQKFIKI